VRLGGAGLLSIAVTAVRLAVTSAYRLIEPGTDRRNRNANRNHIRLVALPGKWLAPVPGLALLAKFPPAPLSGRNQARSRVSKRDPRASTRAIVGIGLVVTTTNRIVVIVARIRKPGARGVGRSLPVGSARTQQERPTTRIIELAELRFGTRCVSAVGIDQCDAAFAAIPTTTVAALADIPAIAATARAQQANRLSATGAEKANGAKGCQEQSFGGFSSHLPLRSNSHATELDRLARIPNRPSGFRPDPSPHI